MVPSFYARLYSPCFGRSFAYQNLIILLLSFIPALLFSILASTFLASSVSLSYFIHAVLMRKCLGKNSCMSSFPIAILNGACFFHIVQCQGIDLLYNSLVLASDSVSS